MNLSCENARSLVPSYLDGELSEEQAKPLRGHLFGCPGCRESAKEGKALQRWFSLGAGEALAVPPGFASRVARRAFAGDGGLALPGEDDAAAVREVTLLPFVLKLSAVAAGLLFAFSAALQQRNLPASTGLDAQFRPPWEREHEVEPGAAAPLPGAAEAARPAEDDDVEREADPEEREPAAERPR